MRIIHVFLLTLLFTTSAIAQGHTIRGRVVASKEGAALRSANVVLVQLPDSVSKGTVTDANGRFALENVRSGSYLLRVSYIGYATVVRELRVGAEDVMVGRIALDEDEIALGEVEVTGKAPMAVAKEDTVEFNTQAFKVNRDATAEDLVTKLPGVTKEDGTLRAQGEDVKKVLVDNKEFFGDDARAVLRNIPAEVIDKIQIYDRQSDQARFTGFSDGNESKTINLMTSGMLRNAVFGKLYGGAGENELYRAGGMLNFFDGDRRISILAMTNNVNEQNFSMDDLLGVMGNSSRGAGFRMMMSRGFNPGGGGFRPPGMSGGIGDFMVNANNGIATTHALGINYSDKWGTGVDVSGSYFFNYSLADANSIVQREYILAGQNGQLYDELARSESDNMNHRLSMRVDWTIDSLNSILYTPRVSMQMNDGSSATDAQSRLASSMLNNGFSNFTSDLSGYNIRNEILYRRSFATRGRTFSLRATMENSANSGDNSLLSRYESFGMNPQVDSVDQRGNLDKKGLSLGSELQYTEPLGESTMLQLRYETSWSDNSSDKKTFNYDVLSMMYDDLDPMVSSEFTSNYLTHMAGAGYRYDDEDAQVTLDAGWQVATLNSESVYPYASTIDRSFGTFMPRAMFRWKFSKLTDWRAFYRSRTNSPSIDQLQDVLNNTNPLQLSIGNPGLDQSYAHFIGTRFSTTFPESGSYMFAFASASMTDDYIANGSWIARTDTTLFGVPMARGTQLTRPVNLSGNYSLRSFLTYGRPVSWLKSNINLNLMGSYSRTPSLINDEKNYAYQPAVGVGVVLASNISQDFDFTLSSQTNLNWVENSLISDRNDRYINQVYRVRLNWTIWGGFVLTSDFAHTSYSGLSEGYNDASSLWNLGLAWKFLEDNQAELRFTLFDVLNENQNIVRNVTETYIEDTRSNVLQRYGLLTFSYTIRSFGTMAR